MTEVLALRDGVLSPHQAITIPQEEAKAYVVRITKGLRRHFYPRLDYRTHSFSVDHLEPSADNVGMLIARFAHDSRGDGVFRFFRGVALEQCMGIWVYSSTSASVSWPHMVLRTSSRHILDSSGRLVNEDLAAV